MKKILALFFSSILALTTLFSSNVLASDTNYNQFIFADGNQANTYHWLTYIDVKCGMNTKAHYSASTQRTVSRMEVDWTAYNLSGAEQFWNHLPLINTTYLYDSSGIGAIRKSFAQFEIQHKTQTWRPKGYVYHCQQWTSNSPSLSTDYAAENAINALKNTSALPTQYANIYDYNTNEQLSIVKNTFNEYYAEELSAYKLENGQNVNGDNFKIIETIIEVGTKLEDNDLQISFNKEKNTNFSYIKVSIPDKVFNKNNEEYKLEGYILVSNGAEKALDFGLIETKIE